MIHSEKIQRVASILAMIRDRMEDGGPYIISAELLTDIIGQRRYPSRSMLAAINDQLFEDCSLMIAELDISEYIVFCSIDLVSIVGISASETRAAINAHDNGPNP